MSARTTKTAFPGPPMPWRERIRRLRVLHTQTERRLDENYPFRAAIDQRISEEEKTREGESLNTQEQGNRDYVAGRHLRGTVAADHVFTEDGHPGTTFDRPALRSIVDLANAGKIDVVVWRDGERMGRNLPEGIAFVDRLLEAGVIVRFVNENIDETEAGYERVLTSLKAAQQENHRRSNKISNTVDKKRADGKWQGQMPEGCENHLRAGRLVPGKTMPAVRHLFDRALAGDSPADIRASLHRTFPRLKWSAAKIRLILQNRTYCGQYRDKTPGHFWVDDDPPIPTIIFERVQQRFTARARGRYRAPYGDQARGWPFVGVITTECGVGLTCSQSTSHTGDKYWYAHCTHRRKEKRTPVCPPNRKPEAVIAEIREELRTLSLDTEVHAAIRAYIKGGLIKQREARQRDLRDLKTRLDEKNRKVRAVALAIAEELDPETANDMREAQRDLRAERDQLASEIADLDASISRDGTASIDDLTRWAGLLDDLPALWDRLAPPGDSDGPSRFSPQQRELLQILFESGG